MVDTNLSVQDFKRYSESNHLGRLYFPNGLGFENGEVTQFHINLKDLYQLVAKWKINSREVSLGDIAGIIAFGSAVKYPGYEERKESGRKYVVFGPEITKTKQVPVQPNDADFLVITEKDLIGEEILKPISLETYDCGTWITKAGVHLVNRGIEQVVKGVRAGDTISASAMREGVPIFYDERLTNLQNRIKVAKGTPRKIFWDEDCNGYLTGKIE